ncbi:carbohydrate ABC transporter permease [Catenuloplanes atrovinosus]|uniref:N,N'-diacetylchitobiose transport system permease protein n=1 Tax=Catenuloplanes atrovinosus TaxID=137266 RepID=A0AAE4CF22_9ACTN|nr:sugar ABC transporter permease [Catenuloplanes atrovinosus]MDR7279195.1 N,N'-diacetylchitobiose transport system permease protein [Catenuloplanes atrovinosus]
MTATIAPPVTPSSPPVAPVRRRPGALPYLLLIPATIAVFATLIYPVGRMVALSFQRGNLGDLITRRTVWVGLDNYRAVLTDGVFWTVLPRTIGFAAVCVSLTLLIATGCALLLQHADRWARVTLSVGMVVAWATPVLIGAVVFKWLFDAEFGVVNWLLTESGLCECRHRSWLGDQWSAFAVLVSIVVWGAVPFAALSIYAGLLTVPPELAEAARMDGAGAHRIFWSITFPLLRPIYAILTVLSVIWDTKVFPQVWLTTKGGPYQGTVMLGVYIYQKGIVSSQFGVASTIAVLMTVMLLGLSWIYVRAMRQEAR